MIGLTPVFNPEIIKYVRGLVAIFVVIYKFTGICYSYFLEKERMKNG